MNKISSIRNASAINNPKLTGFLVMLFSDNVQKKWSSIWILVAIVWTVFVAFLLHNTNKDEYQKVLEFAKVEATASYNKDLVYRRWAASHGGVYVPISEESSPNPYLKHIPARDIETPSGKKLTLINPAYMTRQVHELAEGAYGVKGHITSLNPIRPENKPDLWEAESLRSFVSGAEISQSIEIIDGEDYLRVMYPMVTEDNCLKCHATQGYKIGDIRGGISVSVPLEPYISIYNSLAATRMIRFFLMWACGIFGIVFVKKVINKQFETIKENLKKSESLSGQLAASEKRHRQVAENAEMWIWEVDTSGLYTYCSTGCEHLFGYTVDEIVGKKYFYDLFHPDDRDELKKGAFNVFRNQQAFKEFLKRNLNRAGGTIWLSTSGAPNVDDNGNLLGYRGSDVDVTKRIQSEESRIKLEAQLTQTHKMEAIGTMAGGIAHDFNNLLAIISGNTEIIERRHNSVTPIEKNIIHIKEASNRAKDLTSQILSFSRQEKPELKPVDCSKIVTGTIKLLRSTIPTTVEFIKQQKVDSIIVNADATQLQQVLINLCTNAVHAMDWTGLLTIGLCKEAIASEKMSTGTSSQAGEFVKISVSDTGSGIDNKILEKIFDPFFTTKSTGEGTGMGLSVVHGIVEQHGGFITVESSIDQGTTFDIYIPEFDGEISILQVDDTENLPIGNENILFIDDEECIAQSSKELLEDLGYKVAAVSNSNEGLEIFKANPENFDLVFTDQTMSGMSGSNLAIEILKIRPNIPIILCTGFTATINEEEAKKLGIREFCMKPMGFEQLAKVSRKVLDDISKLK